MATSPARVRSLWATAVVLVLLSAVISLGSPPAGAVVPTDGAHLVLGDLGLEVTVDDGELLVEAAPGGGTGEGSV